MAFDPASFRDRRARVFRHDGAIYRALDDEGLTEWRAVSASPSFRRLVDAGDIVATREVAEQHWPALPDRRLSAGLLHHASIPFVSYPYEWPFGMLQDAALLHLKVIQALLEDDIVPKDASPYNVQWVGTRPVFIDIGSLRRRRSGEPWVGYRQFCQLFLYPLLLQAYRGVAFQPWLRGSAVGITPEQCLRLVSARDFLRRGVLSHVYLHAKVTSRYASLDRDIRADLKEAHFGRAAIAHNVHSLRRLVERLRPRGLDGPWSAYAPSLVYGDDEAARKAAFVRQILASRRWNAVWDLGSNTGTFARIAAGHAEYVLAIDSDAAVVEGLYQALKADASATILPLLGDIADASPRAGWRGAERRRLEDRGRPDLILFLALLHHLVIGASLPLDEVIDWLAGNRSHLVIEFVQRTDPMVERLLRQRGDACEDYELERLERALSARFAIRERQTLAGGRRVLYYVECSDP